MNAYAPFSRVFCEYITTSRLRKLPNIYCESKRTYIRISEGYAEKQFEKCKKVMERVHVPTQKQKYTILDEFEVNRMGLGLNMLVKVEDPLSGNKKKQGVFNDSRVLDVYDKNGKVEEINSKPCNILRMQSTDNHYESKSPFTEYVPVRRRNQVPLLCWKHYTYNVNKPSTSVDENISSGANQVLDKCKASDCKCAFENFEENPKTKEPLSALKNNESPETRPLEKMKPESIDEQLSLMKLLQIVRKRSRNLDQAFKHNLEAMSVSEVEQSSEKKSDYLEPSKLQAALCTRGPLVLLPRNDDDATSDNLSSNLPQPRMIKFTVKHSSGLMKDEKELVTKTRGPKEPIQQKAYDQYITKKGNKNAVKDLYK